jgi:hypothetical protein
VYSCCSPSYIATETGKTPEFGNEIGGEIYLMKVPSGAGSFSVAENWYQSSSDLSITEGEISEQES